MSVTFYFEWRYARYNKAQLTHFEYPYVSP